MASVLFTSPEDEINNNIQVTDIDHQTELVSAIHIHQFDSIGNDIIDNTSDISEAMSAIEEITEISDIIADSVEQNEGIPEDAARTAEVAVEAICTRLGYKPPNTLLPSMESFHIKSSRLDASKYALETFSETINNIWVAIKNFFKRIWNRIVQFWNWLFSSTKSIEKHAEATEQEIKRLKTKVSQEDVHTSINTEKNVIANKIKQIDTDGGILDTCKSIDITKFCEAYELKNPKDFVKEAKQVLLSQAGTITNLFYLNKKLQRSMGAIASLDEVEKIEKELDNIDFMDFFYKNYSYERGTKSIGANTQIFKGLGFNNILETNTNHNVFKGLTIYKDTKPVNEGVVESRVYDLDELESLLTSINVFIRAINKTREIAREFDKSMEAAIRLADSMSNNSNDDTTAISKKKAEVFRTIQNSATMLNINIPSIAVKLADMGLIFIDRNLKCYSM